MKTMRTSSPVDWRADIDGLRAIAVLSVVTYHALPSILPGGFVGVDVFFVISGYLITGILIKEHQSGRFSLRRFYERRARRLFPALALVMAATVAATFLFAYPAAVRQTAKLAVASSFSAANVALWAESGYFDAGSHLKPLLNLWSLGVEEQFYLVWPLLLAALLRSRHLVGIVISGCLLSLAGAEILNHRSSAAAFYLPTFRAWELGVGALLAILERRNWHGAHLLSSTLSRRATEIGVLLILLSALFLNSRVPFPGLSAVPAVLGSALVIWAGSSSSNGMISRTLSSGPLVYIGLISYPLYLWHWPLLSVPLTAGIRLTEPVRALLVVLALVLSAATYRWIETPARRSSDPMRATLLACIALAAVAMLSIAVYWNERQPAASTERARIMSKLDWPGAEAGRNWCPEALRNESPGLSYCRGAGPNQPNAVVWGDSHADHLYPGLSARDSTRDWLLIGHMSCPPTIGIDVAADQPDCRARMTKALAWIEEQKDIQTVVIGFFGHYADDTDVAKQHRDGPVGPSETSINGQYGQAAKTSLFEFGLDRAVSRLVASGKSVTIVIDVPELPFLPVDCFVPPRIPLAQLRCKIPTADVIARQASMRDIVSRLAAKYPDVKVVDPLPAICDQSGCGPGPASQPVYRDSHHLSKHGSSEVAKLILESANQDRRAPHHRDGG